jgi:Do/DeqQ family serine protease
MKRRGLIIAAALLVFAIGSAAANDGFQRDPKRGVMTMAPLLKKATPAVVNISVVTMPRIGIQTPLLEDPFFRRFYGLPEEPDRPQISAAGSGVVVDAENGYVMTNNHVIEYADEVIVTLKDRRRFIAKLVGTDPPTDIALLKIDAKKLTALPMADSGGLEVGDLVVAIGNPFGLGQTVTSGIVSALGRGIAGSGQYEDFIQTDASINPGNSGGALINTKGELIGINSAIIAAGGGNIGIGFAVPSNMARTVMVQLIKYGEVRRGQIGVTIHDVTPDLAAALQLPVQEGAVISEVEAESAAARAGLMVGDVIVEADGVAVQKSADLRNTIGLKERGTEAKLVFYRGGEKMTVSVKIEAQQFAPGVAIESVPSLKGARFGPIPEAHPASPTLRGVYVTKVARGSIAWQMGLRTNDIILSANDKVVESVAVLAKAAQANGPTLALNVLRGDARILLVAR